MTAIFISYRRQDTKQIAGRIFDKLAAKFGAGSVFMDTEGIPFGVNFHTYLDEAVARARIVLVLIGHGWAEAREGAGARRLDSANDFVRIEVEAALRRNVPVGAVLIDGASLPRAEQLPESMRALLQFNAAPVDAGSFFHASMDRLIADLERHLNGKADPPPPVAGGDPALKARPGSGDGFRDVAAAWCPEMVVVPAGGFTMGSPANEEGRSDREGPQVKITIAKPFAIGRYAVTRGEFSTFIGETGHDMSGGAYVWNGVDWVRDAQKSWRDPGYAQDDSHPAVCVSWDDAKAYTKWLSGKTGRDYRLLSEAEWEYACRAGTQTPFWWGSSIVTEQANYDENYTYGGGKKGEWRQKTVPVKSFRPNPWGLYQVHGNVWEWCEDCWNQMHTGAPSDGSARATGDCSLRVLRGGSWNAEPAYLRAAARVRINPDFRNYSAGFRLARTF